MQLLSKNVCLWKKKAAASQHFLKIFHQKIKQEISTLKSPLEILNGRQIWCKFDLLLPSLDHIVQAKQEHRCQGWIQEFRKEGSKIKFMKEKGTGGAFPHPWRGLGHNPSRFFSFPFIWHEIKALFTMIL